MGEKARIDPELFASLRESPRRLRPEASLPMLSTRSANEVTAGEPLQPVLRDLVTRLERLEERIGQLDGSSVTAAALEGHTLFVSTATGYTVIERDGPPPRPGDEVGVDGRAYRAQRYRRSPFPADPRPCVIVEAVRKPVEA